MTDRSPAGPADSAGELDDCPHCGADLVVHRVLYAGLLLLCENCLSEVPPAPASAWGPAVPGRAGNWPSGPRPGAGSRTEGRRRRVPPVRPAG